MGHSPVLGIEVNLVLLCGLRLEQLDPSRVTG